MPFSDYLSEQQKNLDQVTQLRIFRSLVPPIDVFYERSLALVAGHVGPYEGLLVVCYKAFLSAAALISRAQPEDSIAVTRRAIEAACLGRAIKHDPENMKRWAAYPAREVRREARLREVVAFPRLAQNRKSGRRVRLPSVSDPPGHGVVEYLRMMQGFLSDRAVHFTPEFLRNQLAPVEGSVDGGDGGMSSSPSVGLSALSARSRWS